MALALLAVAAAAFGTTTAVASKKSPFKPGLYLGKTSQGEPVKLLVKACGGNSCLYSPTDDDAIYIALPCPSIGETGSELLDLSGYLIAKNGKVNASGGAFAKVTAFFTVAHNGTLTGKIRAVSTSEEGVRCDSGNVTLKAKIGGSTK